ncbi:hypothetical protein C8J57DRAFT_1522717 [Mycena rebaudengoi]|nr:hypothetical protein C8J57DRAFT_1522717 [Mycena rebaudengoi]
MPELPEGITSGTLPQVFIEQQPAANLVICNILADATKAEMPTHPADSAANLGALDSSSCINWGNNNTQTPLYPTRYATSASNPCLPIKNIILKFQDVSGSFYWCQIQLLKHTVSQIYNKADWDEVILVVRSGDRGFKVGITFELKNHVLAFLTLDLLIQVYWADQQDMYLEFPHFLEDLVKWIASQRKVQSSWSGNALLLVRTTTEIFPGAGVYMMSKLWHMAGLSPNLTEAEVFDSSSWTAQLCTAFYHFGKEAHMTLWLLMKRFLVDYVICVQEKHRLLYSEWLHVYGKDRSHVTSRFNSLLNDFEVFCDS